MQWCVTAGEYPVQQLQGPALVFQQAPDRPMVEPQVVKQDKTLVVDIVVGLVLGVERPGGAEAVEEVFDFARVGFEQLFDGFGVYGDIGKFVLLQLLSNQGFHFAWRGNGHFQGGLEEFFQVFAVVFLRALPVAAQRAQHGIGVDAEDEDAALAAEVEFDALQQLDDNGFFAAVEVVDK